MMTDIYRGAVRTVVWLGPDHNFAREAFDLVYRIFAVVEHEYPNHEETTRFEPKMLDEELHAGRGLPARSSEAWDALRTLLDRPWFTRIWVLQEVVLSRQDTLIVCGQENCSWYPLSTACGWLAANDYSNQKFYGLTTVDNVHSMRHVSQEKEQLDVATSILLTTEVFYATDPRDEVFALLGLTSQNESDNITPDYTLNPVEVYRIFARSLIYQQGNLAVLGMPLSRNEHIRDRFRWGGGKTWKSGTPSWVPDLDVRTDFKPYHMLRVSDTHKGCRLSCLKQYRASGNVPIEYRDVPSFSAGVELLRFPLKGLEVDNLSRRFEVKDIRSIRRQTQERRQRFQFVEPAWNYWLDQACVWCGYVAGMRQPISLRVWSEMLKVPPEDDILFLARAMCQTTTVNMGLDRLAPPEEAGFNDFCSYMVDVYNMWGRNFTPSHSQFHRSFDVLRQYAEGGIGSRYQDLMEKGCHMRRVFFTTDGRIGIGPTSMRKGDTVVVLFGAGTP